MFWLIVAAVVVVGLALAWWTSGRAKGGPSGPDRHSAGRDQAVREYRPPGSGIDGSGGGL